MTDRYLKAILTVIAIELLWLGVKDVGTPLAAQATPAPARVIVTGVEIDTATRGALPMFSALPLTVEITRPVKIEADTPVAVSIGGPLKVEADLPLPVRSVPYEPARAPGE
jgi:hypothetical protein